MIRPEQILKELSKLWIDLGHEEQQDASHGQASTGVLRACAMTLITIADESEDPTNVGETVALLMREHPSRSVLIRLRAVENGELESRVFAQCWMPFGQKRQICCEQIEITASIANLGDVPGVVLPLAVPDLPVILWCRSPRLLETAAFPKIAGIADKLIVDTAAFASAADALDCVASQVKSGRLIADLAWSRITRWRETVSQTFGNRECLEALSRFTSARVEFAGAQPRTEALYFAAWLQSGLEKAGNSIQVKLVPAQGPAISALVLEGAGQCDISIRCDSHGSVDVHAGGLSHKTIFPEASDHLALHEELSITGRDPFFESALPGARKLVAG